ncbi:GNAT family N-acetyltransferase [Sebaldella termitidis]|uniref:GNAT family N-acetyltransferase n=1 Tax=Sebaldella termitidis TaxID=826 RepID=UPI003EBC5C10
MISYRKAGKSDIDELVRIRSIFLEEYDRENHLNNKENVDKEVEKYLQKFMDTEVFTGFVAEKDDKIVGTSAIAFYDILPAALYMNGKLGYISNVFVFPEYRKQGIAKKLFELAVNEGFDRNCSKLTLHASKDGEPVYKKFGFVKTVTEMEYVNEKFYNTKK